MMNTKRHPSPSVKLSPADVLEALGLVWAPRLRLGLGAAF